MVFLEQELTTSQDYLSRQSPFPSLISTDSACPSSVATGMSGLFFGQVSSFLMGVRLCSLLTFSCCSLVKDIVQQYTPSVSKGTITSIMASVKHQSSVPASPTHMNTCIFLWESYLDQDQQPQWMLRTDPWYITTITEHTCMAVSNLRHKGEEQLEASGFNLNIGNIFSPSLVFHLLLYVHHHLLFLLFRFHPPHSSNSRKIVGIQFGNNTAALNPGVKGC